MLPPNIQIRRVPGVSPKPAPGGFFSQLSRRLRPWVGSGKPGLSPPRATGCHLEGYVRALAQTPRGQLRLFGQCPIKDTPVFASRVLATAVTMAAVGKENSEDCQAARSRMASRRAAASPPSTASSPGDVTMRRWVSREIQRALVSHRHPPTFDLLIRDTRGCSQRPSPRSRNAPRSWIAIRREEGIEIISIRSN